tara:strand:+ start:7837 stop:8751 length:915 start_codon:yes stop_codon:yes gene_type:complete
MVNNKKLFDIFLFLNEFDLLELRFEILDTIVDYFVITEVNETFSGKPKPLIFKKNILRYKKFQKKIIYNPITQKELKLLREPKWSQYVSNLEKSIPYKHNGRKPINLHKSLKREISHRDASILGIYKIAKSEDYILISDLDEIPNPKAIKEALKSKISKPYYFKMDWFLYWINNKVSNPWFGTVLCKFKNIKGKSIDNLRYASCKEDKLPGPIIKNGGWHFSYLGGIEAILFKLKSHPFQGYRVLISIILDKLKIRSLRERVTNNKDIFFQNRNFSIVKIDNSFPKEIKKDTKFIKKYSFNNKN